MLPILKKTNIARLNIVAKLCKYTSAIVCRQTQTILGQRGVRIASGLTLVAIVSVLFVGFPRLQAANGGLFVHEDWRGAWEVTVSYRDRETGAVSKDVTTTSICPGEPIAPPLPNTIFNAWGKADGRELNLSGQAKYAPLPGCNVLVEVDFNSQRDGDNWSGVGRWTAKVVGNCEHVEFSEDFVVSGRRVSNQAGCDGEGSSLLERFFAHFALVPVLGGSN